MNLYKIWKQTEEYCSGVGSDFLASRKHLPDTVSKPPDRYSNTEVLVVDNDTLDESSRHRNCCCINMGNSVAPGGGVKKGLMAQEEDLFRRTDISRLLDPSLYPIGRGEIIYTKGVTILRKKCTERYEWIRGRPKIDIATCPAYNVYKYGYHKNFETDMEARIENLFKTAYDNRVETLVLSALGCGEFGCDPEIMCRIFRRVIERWHGNFQQVIFAIKKNNYEKCNYYQFKRILETNQ